MKKQILIALAVVFGLMVCLGFVKYLQISSAIAQYANMTPPPEAVTSLVAQEQEWQDALSAVGSITPVQGVILSAEEPGSVVAINFESGAKVNKGDLLIELDTSVEEGNLKAARAREVLAQKSLNRMQGLKNSEAISKNEMDISLSGVDEARGQVAALEGLIAKKKIKAPFSGILGIRDVNVGQYLEAGKEIVPLFALERMYIDFFLPQQAVAKIVPGSEIEFSLDVYPGEVFHAKISAINPQVDMVTRNLKIQAITDNAEGKLRAGMFVKVDAKLAGKRNEIAIPTSSINFAPYGNSVFIIEKMKDPKGQEYSGVRQQIVEVGERRGEQIAIIKGIKPGEEVVTSGVFKLRPGAAVLVNNEYAPKNDINVDPPNT